MGTGKVERTQAISTEMGIGHLGEPGLLDLQIQWVVSTYESGETIWRVFDCLRFMWLRYLSPVQIIGRCSSHPRALAIGSHRLIMHDSRG